MIVIKDMCLQEAHSSSSFYFIFFDLCSDKEQKKNGCNHSHVGFFAPSPKTKGGHYVNNSRNICFFSWVYFCAVQAQGNHIFSSVLLRRTEYLSSAGVR